MRNGLVIRTDIEVDALRRHARLEADGRVAARLLAIANALSGMSRHVAPEAAGMDRQTLRDWVHRFNANGIAGLADRPRSGRRSRLGDGEQAVLKVMILRGPDPEMTASQLGGSLTSAAPLPRAVRGGLLRGRHAPPDEGARSVAPEDPPPPSAERSCGPTGLQKRGLARAVKRIVRRHRDADADVQLWFEDEACVDQKGRNAHVWYQKGQRPTAPTDKRFKSVYVYGTVGPDTDDAFGLVLPHADTAMMALFLDAFSASLAPNVHAILVMDKAGWHVTGRLKVPSKVSLVHLPPYSPELNPVERFWYPQQRHRSHG